MTTRNREQTLAFSEELSTLNCPGSFLFSEPGVVDHWCQSLPGGPTLPLTPPDTDSEPDMSAKWNHTSLPEDSWFTVSAQDNSTYVQSSSSEWDTQTLLSSAQDFQSLDAFHWNHTSHGSVDAGLSPVLSHESQSSHTLNSFSEAELPSGLDLSFTFEPTWNPTGSMMCRDNPSMQRQLPGNAFVPSMDEMPLGNCMDEASTQWPLDFIGYSPQAVFYPQDGQTARLTARSPAVAAPRTLLPRTEGSLAATTPAFAQTSLHRQYQPSTQGGTSSRRSSQNVSNHGYAVHESPRTTSASYIAPRPVTSGDAKMSSGLAMDHFQALPQSHGLPRSYTQDSFSVITDPAAEEFTAFIQYDQDEPSTVTGTSSYATGTASVQATGSSQETTGPVHAKVEVDAKPIKVSPKPAAAPLAEADEGRHRSHPLYAKGPDADGLFRCPFKAKENCPHNPTKLKCNYDKFVDSHLKPFRCRQEACAKQEFSSTACLLRHEREAHGMHGHGDRPHLCFYTGCERGLPGNGFPRRYNLFDHMKRVHDHREDTSTGLPSPETANADSAIHKKTASRKRKAPSSTSSDPVMQKRKTTPQVASQHTPVQGPLLPHQDVLQAPAQPDSHLYASSGYQWPTASQNLQYTVPRTQELPRNDRYSQWTDQRTMASRNFDFVQSPQDLFDQNFQELHHG